MSLGIRAPDLSAMSLDLAACYDKHKLETRMKAVSLEVRRLVFARDWVSLIRSR